MKIKAILISISSAILVTASPLTHSIELQDSFESKDMSATNSKGFEWGKNNSTSVVTQHPEDGKVAVYNNRVIYNISSSPTTHWTANDGQYSLRFRYPSGTDQMAEQRFNMGATYPEIWVRFSLRVPTNYESVSNSRSGNSKLLSLWMDGYEGGGQGATCVWEFWRNSSGGASVALRTRNEMNNYNSGHQKQTPFITYPTDQGRWMELTFRVKAETSQNANDGIMQMWRRWEGESTPKQLHNWAGLDIPIPSSPQGFNAGYLMGWSNPGYLVDTEFLIDGFTISTSSLVLAPKPPIFFAIQ